MKTESVYTLGRELNVCEGKSDTASTGPLVRCDLPFGAQCSYSLSPPMRCLRPLSSLSVVSFTSSSVNVRTPGCAPRTSRPLIPSTPLPHFFPSTTISPRFRSPLTRIFFALAASACDSASTSILRLSVASSACSPARRELLRVGRAVSRFTGSLRRAGFLVEGFGDGFSGMTLFAVAEMSVSTSRFAWMLASRLRSKALILLSSSVLIGIVIGHVLGSQGQRDI